MSSFCNNYKTFVVILYIVTSLIVKGGVVSHVLLCCAMDVEEIRTRVGLEEHAVINVSMYMYVYVFSGGQS